MKKNKLEMRSPIIVRNKMKELNNDAKNALVEHMRRQKEDSSDEVYLRLYNRICEKIGVLSWVLKINKEI